MSGQVTLGLNRSGQVRTRIDQVRSCQIRTSKDEVKSDQGLVSSGNGHVRSGQAMSCHISSGQLKIYQVRSGQGCAVSWGQVMSDHGYGNLQSGQIR